jgi:hypothetical protein
VKIDLFDEQIEAIVNHYLIDLDTTFKEYLQEEDPWPLFEATQEEDLALVQELSHAVDVLLSRLF